MNNWPIGIILFGLAKTIGVKQFFDFFVSHLGCFMVLKITFPATFLDIGDGGFTAFHATGNFSLRVSLFRQS
jgi:hypothetical protein